MKPELVSSHRRASVRPSWAEPLEPRRLLAGQVFAGEGPGLGGMPVAVVTADFNADGKIDLATADTSYGSQRGLSIRLGRGDGTFRVPIGNGPTLNSTPVALATGDLDSDGKTDLIVAGYTGNNSGVVTVLRGNGDGTFGQISTVTINAYPSAVAVGHFNNDTRPDLAVANRNVLGGTASLSVLLNAGGSLGTPVTTALPFSLRDVAARDVSGDGKTDLVVAADFGSPGLSVLRGNGNGTFAAPTAVSTGTAYQSVVAGDFNDDGVQDLAATAKASAAATVHLGVAGGTFAAGASYPVGGPAADLTLADLNADGRPDLVTADGDYNTATVLLNDGAGTFASRTIPTGDRTSGVAVADVTGDGRVDLAVASYYSSSASVLPGRGNGTFVGPVVTPASGTNAISVGRSLSGDFDGDGVLDVVVANTDNGTGNTGTSSIAVRHGNGDGTFAEPVARYTIDADPSAPVRGDFNGDGRLDLAVGSTTFNAVYVLLGRGDGTFTSVRSGGVGSNIAMVALDFDNDGKTDLARMSYDRVSLLRGIGDGQFYPVTLNAPAQPKALASADFNRDGNADLVVADSNGNGAFVTGTKTTVGPVGAVPVAMAAGDYSGDGTADVAVAYSSMNNTGITLLRGGGNTLVSSGGPSLVSAPTALTIADFDGDGLGEVAAMGLNVTRIYLDGFYDPPRVLATGNVGTSLAAGDFNGDGRFDLLSTEQSAVTVSPNRTPVADPAVSVAGGVLTLGPGSATLSATAGVPGGLTVLTAAGRTRLAGDAITRVVLSGATVTLNADLGRVAGNAVGLTAAAGSAATFAVSQHLAALAIDGTATLAAGGGKALRVTGLSLGAAGTLDLNDNVLVYDYPTAAGQAEAVRQLIAAGRSGGTWQGPGLTSTTARDRPTRTTTLGYLEAAAYKTIYGPGTPFAGEPIDATAVLVKYGLSGDADFSGTVDFNDFARLQTGFGQPNATTAGGDFDADGDTDFDDFALLQTNFGSLL